ncbi:unnamed protein product, partial [Polarella glacialis]
MASFYPVKREGPVSAVAVAASLRAGASKQEFVERRNLTPLTPTQLLHKALVAKENSVEDILRIASDDTGVEPDPNNIATAIHKVAQLCKRGQGRSAALGRDQRFAALLQRGRALADSWPPRQLCHVAWSLAVLPSRSGEGGLAAALLDSVSQAFTQRGFAEGVPQDISTFAWSLAVLLAYNQQPALDTAARASLDRLPEFCPQDLSIPAWALSKLLYEDRRPVLDAIAAESLRKIKDFGSRNLANLSWAYATAQQRHLPLYEGLVRECAARASELGPQELPIALWSFAAIGYPSEAVFRAAAETAASNVGGMDMSHLCNVAWAYARAGPRDERLFGALAEAAVQRLGDMEPLHLANLTWAFANVSLYHRHYNDGQISSIRHEPLFRGLASVAVRMADELLPQHRASILWAFATCQVKAGFELVADSMVGGVRAKLREHGPRHVAGMLWSLAVLQPQRREPLVDALLLAATSGGTEGLVRDGPAHLASIVWAGARLTCASHAQLEHALRSDVRCLAAALAGSAQDLSDGRRQNIASVVRSLYDLGLPDSARSLLDNLEDIGLLAPGVEAWGAWLCGAACAGDAELEAKAWAGLAGSCDGPPRSTFALNAAAVRALEAGREDLARWALSLLGDGQGDAASDVLRTRVGRLPAPNGRTVMPECFSPRGEYSGELALVQRLFSCSHAGQPGSLLAAAEAEAAQNPNSAEALGFGAGPRGAALDAALLWAVRFAQDRGERQLVVLEIGCGIGCASIRAAKALGACGARVIGLESDPIRAAAALCVSEWTGSRGDAALAKVQIRVGRSEQLLPQLRKELGPRSVACLVFGGFQGTEYQANLALAEGLGLLADGAVLVADHMLRPVAPEFAWLVSCSGLYQDPVAVSTEDDDWVMIASRALGQGSGLGDTWRPGSPLSAWPWPVAAPPVAAQLRHAADEARRRTLSWRHRNRLVQGTQPLPSAEAEEARSCYRSLGVELLLCWARRSGDASGSFC